MNRREYDVRLFINGKWVRQVVIDPHYEKKHGSYLDDIAILTLVSLLHGTSSVADAIDGPFRYFVSDGLEMDGKRYRLVWLTERHQMYVGVVNAHRRR